MTAEILPFRPADPPPEPGVTVAAVIELYLANLQLRNSCRDYSADALITARRYLASFAARYGNQIVSACRNADLTKWLLEHPEWKSDFTRTDALRAVIACFRWAADEEEIIDHPPYRRPKRLRLRLRPRDPVTYAEFRQMLLGAKNRRGQRRRPSADALRCALHFLWRTGARTCEMRFALWSQLDLGLGILRQRHHKTEGVSDGDRLIGLDDGLLHLLRWMYRVRRTDRRACKCPLADEQQHLIDDHIFRNGRGRAWTRGSFAKLFHTFALRAGISPGKSAYCLRHGFCVQALEAGVGERQLADQMGHSGTRYIAWYGRQTRQHAGHLRAVVKQAGKRNPKT